MARRNISVCVTFIISFHAQSSLVYYRADPSTRMIVNPRPLTPIDKSRVSPSGKAPMKPHPSSSLNAGPQSTGYTSATQKSTPPATNAAFGIKIYIILYYIYIYIYIYIY